MGYREGSIFVSLLLLLCVQYVTAAGEVMLLVARACAADDQSHPFVLCSPPCRYERTGTCGCTVPRTGTIPTLSGVLLNPCPEAHGAGVDNKNFAFRLQYIGIQVQYVNIP